METNNKSEIAVKLNPLFIIRNTGSNPTGISISLANSLPDKGS